ncbi:MAG: ankyrin repeat domain-containing protein [Burkholderia gladioli]
MHTAICNGKASAAKFLSRQTLKRDINPVADAGLLLAASANDPELVEIFRPRANVNKAMAGGRTALMAATTKGSAALSALLPHANREQRDKEGFNALMYAIRNRNEEALALLLREASEKEILGKMKGGKSAREFAEEIQKKEWWSGLPGHSSARPFRPLDIMMVRIEFFEIGKAATAARASSIRPSSSQSREVRRL